MAGPRANHSEGAGQATGELALGIGLVEQMADCLPDTVFFVKHPERGYLAGNHALAGLLGLPNRREIVGRRTDEFFPASTIRYYDGLDAEVIGRGRTLIDRLDWVTGETCDRAWFLYSRMPLRDGSGRVVAALGLSRRLPDPRGEARRYARLAQVSERLQADPGAQIDPAMLAELAGCSRAQLERDFVRVFGVSPMRYRARLRLQLARFLLAGSAPIAEVAQDCGFADQSAFTRWFRRATGLAPGSWRRRAAGASLGSGAIAVLR